MGRGGLINSILIVQGWAMLWVVIGHAPLDSVAGNPTIVQWLYDIAYAFHMPLFVFVSGYLFQLTRIAKGYSYKDMMVEKLQRLGIPYVAFTVIAMVCKSIMPEAVKRQSALSISEFAYAMICPSDGPLNELWFVMMLLCLFALYPLWKMRGKWALVLAVALVVLLHAVPFFEPNIFAVQSLCQHAIYFLLGTLAARYRSERLFSRRNVVAVVITLALSALSDYLMWWHIKPFQMTIALTGILLSLLLAEGCNRFIPWLFASFRGYTYQIYLMGIFVQIAVKYLYRHNFIENYALGYVLCIVLAIYIPVGVSFVAQRINNRFINLCLGLRGKSK